MLLQRATLPAIVTQHLEEAAFSWLRRSEALWHPAYNREHFHRLDWLLDAHLEGLRVAGGASVMPALESLARWKSADEVFVSACRFEAAWAQALLGNNTAAAKGLVRAIYDPETGLQYNRFRYYDPQCGQYLSPTRCHRTPAPRNAPIASGK